MFKWIRNIDWSNFGISLCDGVLRLLCAAFWLALLCSFSFFDLINFMIHTSPNHTISMEIIKEMKEFGMIISNIGLIGMAYLDNVLLSMLTKRGNESNFQKIVLLCTIVVSVYLAVISQSVNMENPNLCWESMPITLFVIYLIGLLIYKMQSLEIVHTNGKAF